jgi:hypothetical protein
MRFDLRAAIATLDETSVFEIANIARPAGDYLFNAILPNINMETYDIDAGSMTIRTTMAQLTGMDSNYAPGGAVEESQMAGKTGKMGITMDLPEKLLRDLQQMLMRLTAQGVDTVEAITENGMNFFNKIIVQALLDREEWLKGQALFTGELDWTSMGKRLQADYGIPAENFLTSRTGNDGYGGTTSKFWVDWFDAMDILNWRISVSVCHPTTAKVIMANAEVNQLQFTFMDPEGGVFEFARLVTRGGNTVLSSDPRDRFRLLTYNKEGEVLDLANPGQTVKVPFCPVGKILHVGAPVTDSTFIVGEGATDEPTINTPVRIGYSHVAPTTEGGGTPGRWGRLYVPENRPWAMAADGAENFLPVIQAPDRLVIATTEIV